VRVAEYENLVRSILDRILRDLAKQYIEFYLEHKNIVCRDGQNTSTFDIVEVLQRI
jgi:hypothetical protein